MVKGRKSTGQKSEKSGEKLWPELLGSTHKSWLSSAILASQQPESSLDHAIATAVYIGEQADVVRVAEDLQDGLHEWQLELIKKRKQESYSLTTEAGPLWLVSPHNTSLPEVSDHGGFLSNSLYAQGRDAVGSFLFGCLGLKEFDQLLVCIKGASQNEKLGVLVGLELSSYNFQNKRRVGFPQLVLMGVSEKLIVDAQRIADSVNVSRQLVNMPAADLNPKSYAEFVKQLFSKSKTTDVVVWDWERLKKEKLNLIVAVGQAAEEKPCLIHIKYRPESSRTKKPLAFVGKGITYDTGGLDMKSPVGMRNMKKDMGGSATVLGLAHWLENSGYKTPCDFYLAVAENSVASNAYRPGDILKSRSGKEIEIHNTDAEGRLVLADAIEVALSASGVDEPTSLVNVATLTGAVKIALGTDLFGVFSNDDDLSDKIADASYAMGDLSWRMPLFRPYKRLLQSTVADCSNAASTSLGGSITAALFLEQFVNGRKPWAHLDIYAWADGPIGPYCEPGATGQAVQCLIGYITGKS